MRPGTISTPEGAIIFLEAASLYFANRDTNGEDRAYWSNVYNSENCLKIVDLIKSLTTEPEQSIITV